MVHYINKYTETPEKHKEIRWKTLNWSLIIWVSIAELLIIGALLAGGVYGIIESNTLLAVYSFVMAIVFVAAGMAFPNTIYTHLKMPKTFLEINIDFFDDEIQILASNGKSKKIEYQDVCNIKETKNYFVIIFKESENVRSYLSVKKSAFISGNTMTFLNFINNKCTMKTC